MRETRHRAAAIALAALAMAASGCNGRRAEEEAKAEAARKVEAARQAEEARRDAERATKLAEALQTLKGLPGVGDAARETFATVRKNSPSKFKSDIGEMERCHLEQIGPAVKAALERRYLEVGPPVAECLVSMEALQERWMSRLLASLKDDTRPAPSEREQKIESALLDMSAATLKVAAEMLREMLDYGPPDVRLATFEAIAAKVPTEKGGWKWTHALLQRGYAGENVQAAKAKMAARLKELGVPLEPPSPSPAPSPEATGSPAAGPAPAR